MYSYKSRIRYSELDESGHLRLESLLDYFQDCSTFQSEDIGLGVDCLKKRHLIWVMSSWQIVVERYPDLCEWVTIGTIPYDFKGFLGFRNFLMTDEEGRRLACANTIWSLLDTRTGMPVKAPEDMQEKYVLGPKLDMEYAPRKIRIPEKMERREKVRICPHHLDTNHHVNNGQFIRIATASLATAKLTVDSLPVDRLAMDSSETANLAVGGSAMDNPGNGGRVKQLRAEYKKQVVLGDVLTPYTMTEKDGRTIVVLKDETDSICCIVEVR